MVARKALMLAILVGLLLLLRPVTSSGQTIWIEGPLGGTSWRVHLGERFEFRVLAENGGKGILGAKFRIAGLPAGWATELAPRSETLFLGDPFERGIVMAFSEREIDAPDRPVELCTISVFPITDVHHQNLVVTRYPSAAGQGLDCPVLFRRDGETLTRSCADGGTAILNPISTAAGPWRADTSAAR